MILLLMAGSKQGPGRSPHSRIWRIVEKRVGLNRGADGSSGYGIVTLKGVQRKDKPGAILFYASKPSNDLPETVNMTYLIIPLKSPNTHHGTIDAYSGC